MNRLCTVYCEVKLKDSGLFLNTEIIKLPFILLLSFCLTTIFQHYHRMWFPLEFLVQEKVLLIGVYLALF